MSYNKDRKISEHTERLAGEFLFEKQELLTKALDMRTAIKTKEVMQCLTYYGILSEGSTSDMAKVVKDLVERLLMSQDGMRAEQAVEVLRQNFPKKVEIEKGSDRESQT